MTYTFAPKLPGPPGKEGTRDPADYIVGYLPDYAQHLGRFGAAAMRADAVDALTKEIARLRNAHTQRCELCMRLRRRSAVDGGLDEQMVNDVATGDVGAMSDAQRAVVALVDAFNRSPAEIPPATRELLLGTYTADEITELLACVVTWTGNRLLVALGLDAPVEDAAVTEFDYLADGAQSYFRSGR